MNPAAVRTTFSRGYTIIDAWRNDCDSSHLAKHMSTEEQTTELIEAVISPSPDFQFDLPQGHSHPAVMSARSGAKRKRGADVLQEISPNIASMASKSPASTPEKRRKPNQARKGLSKVNVGESEDERLQEETTPRPRRSRVTQSQPTAASATKKGQLGDTADDERGHSQPRETSAYISALTHGAIPSMGPYSRSQSSTGNSSRRSKSPVKHMADLRLADKPILDAVFGNNISQLPPDIRETYRQLRKLSDGEGVLPAAIKHEIEACAGDMESLRSYMFDDETVATGETRTQLLRDLDEVVEICNASRKCAQDCVAEPAWNDEVHSRILRLALKRVEGVEHQNITTARTLPTLVPRHVSGDFLRSKMVDYSINLIPDSDMDLRIRRILQHEPRDLQTINQTMYGPARYRPIAISIETKTPDAPEQEARMQLGMWEAAYFNRMRPLIHDDLVMITLPVLFASGNQWFALFASDQAQHIKLLGKLLSGDSSSLIGCYKILAVIRCSCEWATTAFRDWLMSTALTNLVD